MYEKPMEKKLPNTLRGVPNCLAKLINAQFRTCPLCEEKKSSANSWHLKYKHHMIVPNVLTIWRKEIVPVTTVSSMKRSEIRLTLEPIIESYLNCLEPILI